MADLTLPDPTLPQSAFPYSPGIATPATPTGAEQIVSANCSLAKRGPLYIKAGWAPVPGWMPTPPGPLALGLQVPDDGDNDNVLLIVNTDGFAHIITGPANIIDGDKSWVC